MNISLLKDPDNSFPISVDFAKKIGIEKSIFVSYLMHNNFYELTELSSKKMFKETLLTDDVQNSCIALLTSLGIIEKKTLGFPAKRHLRLIKGFENKILSIQNETPVKRSIPSNEHKLCVYLENKLTEFKKTLLSLPNNEYQTKKNCVYFLFDKSNEIVYVGKSANVVENRIISHKKTKLFEYVKCVSFESRIQCEDFEQICIFFFAPKYNKSVFLRDIPNK